MMTQIHRILTKTINAHDILTKTYAKKTNETIREKRKKFQKIDD